MKARSLQTLQAFLLISSLTGAGALAQQPAPALARLAGSWTAVQGDLRHRLTFTAGGDEQPLTLEPQPEASPPGWLTKSFVTGEALLGGGKLTLGERTADFWLAARRGRHVLRLVPPGGASAVEMHIQWIPAVHAAEDLLLVGGDKPLDPYFPYERTLVAERLSPETRRHIHAVLEARGTDSLELFLGLAQRADWSAAAEYLELDVRTMPHGRLNNACLALARLAEARLEEIELDVAALSRAVENASSTASRSKCARVLATAAARPGLFEGTTTVALRALIRRLPSQHALEVEPALTALERLTGENFGRDPERWARWFEASHGEPLDFQGAVKERIYALHVDESKNATLYEIEGWTSRGLEALEDHLVDLVAEARELNLESHLVIYSNQLPVGKDSPAEMPGAAGVLAAARRAGFTTMSLAKPSVEIYPPWRTTPPTP